MIYGNFSILIFLSDQQNNWQLAGSLWVWPMIFYSKISIMAWQNDLFYNIENEDKTVNFPIIGSCSFMISITLIGL